MSNTKNSLSFEEYMTGLVGDIKAKALCAELDAFTKKLHHKLDEAIGSLVVDERNLFKQQLENTEFDAHRDEVLNMLRNEVVHTVGCDLLFLAATTMASNREPISEYAFHAITHYESALTRQYKQEQFGSLLSRLINLPRTMPEHPTTKEDGPIS